MKNINDEWTYTLEHTNDEGKSWPAIGSGCYGGFGIFAATEVDAKLQVLLMHQMNLYPKQIVSIEVEHKKIVG